MRNFMEMLRAKWAEGKFVCVGLDSEWGKVPQCADAGLPPIRVRKFNDDIIKKTHDLVCAYKPNIAFYADRGLEGLSDLITTVKTIKIVAPDVPVILDCKRADIGNTNRGYAKEAFDVFGADAVTVNPYFGSEALQPFLERAEKGIIVLCRTSNKGAAEFQNQSVWVEKDEVLYEGVGREVLDQDPMGNPTQWAVPLYQLVAHNVARKWNKNGNCALVVGATAPEELANVRKIVGDGFPLLIPGIGKQGGDLEKTVNAGKDGNGQGMIINSSSGIIFASSGEDFAEVARRETEKLHTQITQILKGAVTV